MKKNNDLAWLFCINLLISAFTFGGGYVVIPMIRKYYVEKRNYFDEAELMRIAAISQSSPGAIAVNMSALAGYRVAGTAGLALSCAAAILPPLIILAIVSAIYVSVRDLWAVNAVLKGMEAGVAALIVELIRDMYALILRERSWFFSLLAPAVFLLNTLFHVNVTVLILGSAALCAARVWILQKRR